MAGTKGHSGGVRPGAGRKPSALRADHDALFAEGWPRERRLAAVRRLADIVESGDDELALKAAEVLFNRVFGKPTERKEMTFDKPLHEMSDDELRAIAEG